MMLAVENLACRLQGRTIISGLDFTVARGEVLAVLGQNGAGKSTLMKLLSGQLQPQEGSIRWNGAPISEATLEQMARERGILSQQPSAAYDFSVAEIVMMGRYPHYNGVPAPQDRRAVACAVSDADMEALKARNILQLSGGEQQRAHFARTLAQVHDENGAPKLLLLDEPLKNLDIRYQHHILGVAKKFALRGNVVVAVLHDCNQAALYADKILLLKNGRMLAYGDRDSTLTAPLLSRCFDIDARVERHPGRGDLLIFFDPPTPSEGLDRSSTFYSEHTFKETV